MKNAEAIKTSAFDSLWAIIIYFGFRKFFGGEMFPALLLDTAAIVTVVIFIFVAGITE